MLEILFLPFKIVLFAVKVALAILFFVLALLLLPFFLLAGFVLLLKCILP